MNPLRIADEPPTGCVRPTIGSTMHLQDLAAAVDALTQPYKHIEPYETIDRHRNRKLSHVWVTEQPSLLDQLAVAVMPGGAYTEDTGAGGRSVPDSTPPARLDAIDRLLAIEAGAARWCASLGIPLRADTGRNLRALVGARTDSDTAAALLDELRAWVTWARVVAGWQTPPWRPHVPCPVCERRGLRVRLDRRTACCLECGAVWGETDIGVLADYIATATRAPA